MSKTETPSIRFHGFEDAWEQRKLATMCEKFTDGDWIEAKDQSDAGIRLVQTGNIGIAEYLDKPNNKKWISEETFERLHCEEVYPNDILISRLPEPAGRACIMPNLGTKMITAVDCTIVRPSKDVSANFLLQYLSSQPYFDEVNTCLAGGTRQRISRGNLAGFDVPIPIDKTEQDVIGNFLCALDNLITLHQRKFEKLTNVKKSMLEKMFPKDGADVPEVRFKGFTGAWKRKRFSELYESVIQKNDLTYGVDKNITVASMQYRPDIKVTDIEYLRTYNVLKLGDIAFEGHQSKEFRYGRFVENDIGDGIVSHIFAVFRPKTDYDLMFWKYAINNERIMRPVLVRCTKASTMMNDLVSKDFLEKDRYSFVRNRSTNFFATGRT